MERARRAALWPALRFASCLSPTAMSGNAEQQHMEVILGLVGAMQTYLNEEARNELEALVNAYRHNRITAGTMRAVIADFGQSRPSTRSTSAAQTPTSSETGTPLWATGQSMGGPLEAGTPLWDAGHLTGRTWLDVLGPPQQYQPKGKGGGFDEQAFFKGQDKGRGKGKGSGGFDEQAFFKGQDKGRGKGKGKKGKNKHGFQTVAAAKQALQQFLQENREFVFHPREGVPPEHREVYSLLAEKDEKLYKNLSKHFKGSPEDFALLLRAMAENTHWPVDRLNDVEKRSAQNREGDVASRASNVSRASWLSSVSRR